MRTLTLMSVLLFFASCASSSRGPASVVGNCEIQKHGKNDWYRLTVEGKPAFKSWYTEEQVLKHLNSFEKNGKCN